MSHEEIGELEKSTWATLSLIAAFPMNLTRRVSHLLTTANLELVVPSLEEARARINQLPDEHKQQVSADWLAKLAALTSPDPWVLGFTMRNREEGNEVGECGFKGPPLEDGSVEIAYAVHPDQQCRGYATESAEAMVEYAFRSEEVSVVRAHTLPEENASTRVLTKCGFQCLGEVVDPDDGVVWRWERKRQSQS